MGNAISAKLHDLKTKFESGAEWTNRLAELQDLVREVHQVYAAGLEAAHAYMAAVHGIQRMEDKAKTEIEKVLKVYDPFKMRAETLLQKMQTRGEKRPGSPLPSGCNSSPANKRANHGP